MSSQRSEFEDGLEFGVGVSNISHFKTYTRQFLRKHGARVLSNLCVGVKDQGPGDEANITGPRDNLSQGKERRRKSRRGAKQVKANIL
uniref:Uncharacterized protein n=1 Tax=Amphimedon queenslandica TaxID=400682 RepID=A0A1X7VMM1_AMPQE